MHSKLLFNVLLVGLLMQCAGCGNPQQELWDKYNSSMKKVGENHENPAAALVHAQSCLSTLQQIKKENPNAIKPDAKSKKGQDVDSQIKTVEDIIGSLENFQRMEKSSKEFDRAMEDLNR